jgi:hypothetical protein
MTTTYLGHDLVLPAGPLAKQIKDKLSKSGPADIESITLDLSRQDSHGILELNDLAIKAKVGTVMLATAASFSAAHKFNYNDTIRLLTQVKDLGIAGALSADEIDLVAVKLIRGYSTRLRLNLLTSMAPLFVSGSRFSRSEPIDRALAEHLEKTRSRELTNADVLHIADGLTKAHLMATLKTFTKILVDSHKYEEIRQIFGTYYDNNDLLASDLKAFREVLGDDLTIQLCQEKMMKNDGQVSIHRVGQVFSEQLLLSEWFVGQLKEGLNGTPVFKPQYWANLSSYNVSTLIDHWPETTKLMIEFYDVTPTSYTPNPSQEFVGFAIKHNLHLTLLGKAIDFLKRTLIETTSEPDPEIANMNRSEVLSYASANLRGIFMRKSSYNTCLDICHEIGLIESKSVIQDIKPKVITDLLELHGQVETVFEIMANYPQSKGLFLEEALGL